jgi:hypothetical protein
VENNANMDLKELGLEHGLETSGVPLWMR